MRTSSICSDAAPNRWAARGGIERDVVVVVRDRSHPTRFRGSGKQIAELDPRRDQTIGGASPEER